MKRFYEIKYIEKYLRYSSIIYAKNVSFDFNNTEDLADVNKLKKMIHRLDTCRFNWPYLQQEHNMFRELWGRMTNLSMAELTIQLRDYPMAFIETDGLNLHGILIGAQLLDPINYKHTTPIRTMKLFPDVDNISNNIIALKPINTIPLKIYHDLTLETDALRVTHGVSLAPAISAFAEATSLLVPENQKHKEEITWQNANERLQGLKWWDHLRYKFHGDLRLKASDFTVLLFSSISPYDEDAGRLEADELVIDLTRGLWKLDTRNFTISIERSFEENKHNPKYMDPFGAVIDHKTVDSDDEDHDRVETIGSEKNIADGRAIVVPTFAANIEFDWINTLDDSGNHHEYNYLSNVTTMKTLYENRADFYTKFIAQEMRFKCKILLLKKHGIDLDEIEVNPNNPFAFADSSIIPHVTLRIEGLNWINRLIDLYAEPPLYLDRVPIYVFDRKYNKRLPHKLPFIKGKSLGKVIRSMAYAGHVDNPRVELLCVQEKEQIMKDGKIQTIDDSIHAMMILADALDVDCIYTKNIEDEYNIQDASLDILDAQVYLLNEDDPNYKSIHDEIEQIPDPFADDVIYNFSRVSTGEFISPFETNTAGKSATLFFTTDVLAYRSSSLINYGKENKLRLRERKHNTNKIKTAPFSMPADVYDDRQTDLWSKLFPYLDKHSINKSKDNDIKSRRHSIKPTHRANISALAMPSSRRKSVLVRPRTSSITELLAQFNSMEESNDNNKSQRRNSSIDDIIPDIHIGSANAMSANIRQVSDRNPIVSRLLDHSAYKESRKSSFADQMNISSNIIKQKLDRMKGLDWKHFGFSKNYTTKGWPLYNVPVKKIDKDPDRWLIAELRLGWGNEIESALDDWVRAWNSTDHVHNKNLSQEELEKKYFENIINSHRKSNSDQFINHNSPTLQPSLADYILDELDEVHEHPLKNHHDETIIDHEEKNINDDDDEIDYTIATPLIRDKSKWRSFYVFDLLAPQVNFYSLKTNSSLLLTATHARVAQSGQRVTLHNDDLNHQRIAPVIHFKKEFTASIWSTILYVSPLDIEIDAGVQWKEQNDDSNVFSKIIDKPCTVYYSDTYDVDIDERLKRYGYKLIDFDKGIITSITNVKDKKD